MVVVGRADSFSGNGHGAEGRQTGRVAVPVDEPAGKSKFDGDYDEVTAASMVRQRGAGDGVALTGVKWEDR